MSNIMTVQCSHTDKKSFQGLQREALKMAVQETWNKSLRDKPFSPPEREQNKNGLQLTNKEL